MRSICNSKHGILLSNARLLVAFAPNTPPHGAKKRGDFCAGKKCRRIDTA